MKVVKHVMRKLGHPVSRPLRTMGYRDFTSNDDWKNKLYSCSQTFNDKRGGHNTCYEGRKRYRKRIT